MFRDKKRGESPFISLYGFLALSAALHFCVLLFFSGIVSSLPFTPHKSTLNVALSPGRLSNHTAQLRTNILTQETGTKKFAPAIHESAYPSPQNISPVQSPTSSNRWHFAHELETQPEPLEDIPLENYFENAPNETGRIQLLLLISNDGVVRWVYAEESDFSDDINSQIFSKILNLKFKPGQWNGLPVNSLIRIEVSRNDEIQ